MLIFSSNASGVVMCPIFVMPLSRYKLRWSIHLFAMVVTVFLYAHILQM